jgi:hypothetical protein
MTVTDFGVSTSGAVNLLDDGSATRLASILTVETSVLSSEPGRWRPARRRRPRGSDAAAAAPGQARETGDGGRAQGATGRLHNAGREFGLRMIVLDPRARPIDGAALLEIARRS